MKILTYNFSNALYYIMEGWRQVFTRSGHEWRWFQPGEAILDVFEEYKPDLLIWVTYDINSALIKALRRYPETKVLMKANNWGYLDSEINLEEFPIGVSNVKEQKIVEHLKLETGKPDFVFNFYHINKYQGTMEKWQNELGIGLVEGLPAADIFNYKKVESRPELICDVGFVGGYWPYKARNLDKYLIPLCYPVGKYNVKIFGNQPWPVPQYMGNADNNTVEALFASATICPNISEPHANVWGFEVNERIFKLAYTKSFCINDEISSLHEDIFTKNELIIADSPEHFHDLVHMFTINPDLRQVSIDSCYNTVKNSHTYCHRVANIFNQLNMPDEAKKALGLLETADVQV